MANIPSTHNKPVMNPPQIRRGRRVSAPENTAEKKSDQGSGKERRRIRDRRRKQIAVRFERRNRLSNRRNARRAHLSKAAEPELQEKLGKHINTLA